MILRYLRSLHIIVSPLDRRKGLLRAGPIVVPCALGRAGAGLKKREGDGVTPIGTYALRRLHYRADRVRRPLCGLSVRRIGKGDWWSDDPKDRSYNRLVTQRQPPVDAREGLAREDHVYDLVIEIGYNDAPVVRGRGSGIFLHLARKNFAPTQGCIALTREALLQILPLIGRRTRIRIG